MSNEYESNDGRGQAYKCGGIPMYPEEYHFHIDNPIEFSEDEIQDRKMRVDKFLNQYGLKLTND